MYFIEIYPNISDSILDFEIYYAKVGCFFSQHEFGVAYRKSNKTSPDKKYLSGHGLELALTIHTNEHEEEEVRCITGQGEGEGACYVCITTPRQGSTGGPTDLFTLGYKHRLYYIHIRGGLLLRIRR